MKLVFKLKGSAGAKKKHEDPIVSDVCVIAPGDQTEKRDIVLDRSKSCHPNQKEVAEINQFHPMYDPTCYPLILPGGDDGFSFDSELTKTNGKKISELYLSMSKSEKTILTLCIKQIIWARSFYVTSGARLKGKSWPT